MLMVYRILTGKTEMDTLFQTTVGEQRTRGHQMKLRKPMAVKTVRRHHLKVRAIDNWNSLPQDVASAPSLNELKSNLYKYWKDKW